MNEPTDATQNPPSNATPQSAEGEGLREFARRLADLLPAAVHPELRFADKGIFIAETHLDAVLEAYRRWLGSVTGVERELSRDKCLRRLFGEETPDLGYLVDGKVCLIGYLVPLPKVSQIRSAIPSCIGSLQSARDALHPRDPILQQIAGLAATFGPEGLRLEVKVSGNGVCITPQALDQFARIFSVTHWLQRLSGQTQTSRREALRLLVRLLERVKPPPRGRAVLIPRRFRGQREARFLTLGTLVMVVTPDRGLVSVYDLRRPNLLPWLTEECRSMVSGATTPVRCGAAMVRNSGPDCTITVRADDGIFEIELRSLQVVIAEIQRDQRTQPRFFTLDDLLHGLAKLFQRSAWIAPHAVPREMAELFERYARPRSAFGWYFFLDKQNRVCASALKRGTEPYTVLQGPAPQAREAQPRGPRPPRGGRPRRGGGGGGRGPRRGREERRR